MIRKVSRYVTSDGEMHSTVEQAIEYMESNFNEYITNCIESIGDKDISLMVSRKLALKLSLKFLQDREKIIDMLNFSSDKNQFSEENK